MSKKMWPNRGQAGASAGSGPAMRGTERETSLEAARIERERILKLKRTAMEPEPLAEPEFAFVPDGMPDLIDEDALLRGEVPMPEGLAAMPGYANVQRVESEPIAETGGADVVMHPSAPHPADMPEAPRHDAADPAPERGSITTANPSRLTFLGDAPVDVPERDLSHVLQEPDPVLTEPVAPAAPKVTRPEPAPATFPPRYQRRLTVARGLVIAAVAVLLAGYIFPRDTPDRVSRFVTGVLAPMPELPPVTAATVAPSGAETPVRISAFTAAPAVDTGAGRADITSVALTVQAPGQSIAVPTPPAPPRRAIAPVTPDSNAALSALAEQPLRVYLQVPQGAPAAEGTALFDRLTEAGLNVQPPFQMAYSARAAQVRYYHSADAQAATRLAIAIGALAHEATDVRLAPAPGTLEIWMAGGDVAN